jgi:hypothetical protein
MRGWIQRRINDAYWPTILKALRSDRMIGKRLFFGNTAATFE